MEALRHFWEIAAPYFGITGIFGFIASCILFPLIRGKVQKASMGFDRALAENNKKVEECFSACVDRVKDISFKQSIQPLVESELEKVNERASAYVEKEVTALRKSNEQLLAAVAAMGAFFDDSYISEEKKAAFAAAIAAAKVPTAEQDIEVCVVEEDAPARVKKHAKKYEVVR